MIKEYEKKRDDDFWNNILHGEKLLSDKEADEMLNLSKKLRKESWVRNASRT